MRSWYASLEKSSVDLKSDFAFLKTSNDFAD